MTPRPPVPWFHYLSNENYGLQFSQTGGGFSIFPILEGRRLTYATRDDHPGRYVYFRDEDNGEVWTVNGLSGKERNFECRHGLGYSAIRSSAFGISSELRVFVAPDDPLEVWSVSVINDTRRKRRLALYPFVEWFLGNSLDLWDEPSWYTETRFVPSERAIVATLHDPKRLGAEYQAFLAPFFPVRSYSCSRTAFLGNARDLSRPAALVEGSLDHRIARGEETVAVVEHTCELGAGERRSFHLILGFSPSPARRRRWIRIYRQASRRGAAFRKVQRFWNDVVMRNRIETPSPSFNRWINVWLKYQEHQCHRWAGGGAANAPLLGYRDALQHAMGLALFDPVSARERFLEALRYQYRNGRAVRQWSRQGNHDTRDYRDSPVWIVFALTAYLKETGAFDLLDERVGYLDGGEGTVLQHANAAMDSLFGDRGAHGLSHIGAGDWLDPLNRVGIWGRGESIWLSMALHLALKQMAELAVFLGDRRGAMRRERQAGTLRRCIERHGWDGAWYLQAYDDGGRLVGSRRNREGSIFLMPQAWAVISGVADPTRARQCMASADERLRTEFGYRMWFPGYTRYRDGLGGISILKNQAPVYSHAGAFKMLADCVLGRGDAAFRTFCAMVPDNPRNPPERSWAPPHIIPNGYSAAEDDGRYGRMLFYGFSGTFPWLLKIAVERILGARAEYGGLRMDPCLPTGWPGARIQRTFRGAVFDIAIERNGARATRELWVDGAKLESDFIPWPVRGRRHTVRCVLGASPPAAEGRKTFFP
ncbi:MAG: hypothetical protein IT578_00645 [Verrucomicrobiae bacterium]|nr:hypothetical protein [Verrucomicrobiae bacterium]